MKKYIVIFLILGLSSTSCVVVKEHEKVFLNDVDMKLSSNTIDRFETNFQVYREAAAGANGGKTGGGCGCN